MVLLQKFNAIHVHGRVGAEGANKFFNRKWPFMTVLWPILGKNSRASLAVRFPEAQNRKGTESGLGKGMMAKDQTLGFLALVPYLKIVLRC